MNIHLILTFYNRSFTVSYRLLIGVLLYAPLAVNAQSLFEGRLSLIILNSRNYETLHQAYTIVEKNGGHITHLFPPNIMHGYLTPSSDSALRQMNIVKVITEKLYPIEAQYYSTNENLAIETWNARFLTSPIPTRELERKGDKDRGTTKAPDATIPNNRFMLRGQKNYYLTSEYMIGTIALGVFFVECDGTFDRKTEEWYLEDKIDAMQQIYKGMDWWAENGGYMASLTFIYDIQHVSTRFEPINRTKDESALWINEIMQEFGYYKGEDYTVNREYVNDLRDKYRADWAFNLYMVPAINDEDGYFAGQTGIAWAYLGGPYMVLSNKCNGWGFSQVWKVVAHETAHIFNALDEYKGSGTAFEKSGRLNVVNGNHEEAANPGEPCIMKASDLNICRFTRGQIGWVDEDSNGVFDSDYLNISRRFNTEKAKQEMSVSLAYNSGHLRHKNRFTDEEKILYYDDFSIKGLWYEDKYNYIVHNAYHMFDPEYGTASWLEKSYDDFSVSVRTRWIEGSSVSGYGLMFRVFGPNDSYIFYINGDGQYCIGKYLYGNWNYLKDWDRSSAIRRNSENWLRVDCTGKTLSFYINKTHVATIEDSTFRKGGIGFAVLPEVHILFDDLLITKP